MDVPVLYSIQHLHTVGGMVTDAVLYLTLILTLGLCGTRMVTRPQVQHRRTHFPKRRLIEEHEQPNWDSRMYVPFQMSVERPVPYIWQLCCPDRVCDLHQFNSFVAAEIRVTCRVHAAGNPACSLQGHTRLIAGHLGQQVQTEIPVSRAFSLESILK